MAGCNPLLALSVAVISMSNPDTPPVPLTHGGSGLEAGGSSSHADIDLVSVASSSEEELEYAVADDDDGDD